MTPTVPRFEELVAPSHWRTVDFISDLHLQACEPATVAAFQQYLESTPADAVFILGDLFEVWVGDDALREPGSFEAQGCAALQAAGAHTLIHGHTHRPALHVLAPGLQRVVLSDWDAAALPPRLETLRLSSAGLERLSLAPK